jgi:hypothetical protein
LRNQENRELVFAASLIFFLSPGTYLFFGNAVARVGGGSLTDQRLNEEELHAMESALRDLRRTMAAGEFFEAERILRRPPLDASTVSRLIVEVLRLRTLVKDAAPYFDGMETDARGLRHERRIRQLQVRLRAEVDRG